VLEATEGRGVDVVFDNVGPAVFEKSANCIAYDGRYLLMGFASDKTKADEPWIVPRRLLAGNFKLCGVLLAYAPEPVAKMMKKATGWNFVPDTRGQQIMREIVEAVQKKELRPVIGRVAPFEEIPAAIHAMAARQTLGRTIIQLW
jgi:NADPH2:quinone reductase